MAAVLRSKSSRDTASAAASQFRYFIQNHMHAGRVNRFQRTSGFDRIHHSNFNFLSNPTRCTTVSLHGQYIQGGKSCGVFSGNKRKVRNYSSQGDPPYLWAPPGEEGVADEPNAGSGTKEGYWGGSNLGMDFPTPKEICKGLDKFVIGQERAKKVNLFAFDDALLITLGGEEGGVKALI